MIQFGWIENGLVVFAFQSPHNLWLLDLLNYSAISGIMFAEIDRNGRSEELVKLGGGQKNFIFRRGGVALWGRGQKIFIFREGFALWGKGLIF